MYEFLSNYPERSSRFANMMRGFTSGPSFDLKFVTDFYPWEDHNDGIVVDVSIYPPPPLFNGGYGNSSSDVEHRAAHLHRSEGHKVLSAKPSRGNFPP